MSLTTAWSPFFQSTARMRGRALQTEGKIVGIEPAQGELLRFEIEGDPTHESAFELEDKRLSASCTCETFEGGRYCEHIWGALVMVQHDPSVFGEAGQKMLRHRPRPPKARRRLGRTRARSAREPEWMGRLSLLRPSTTGPDALTRDMPEHRQIGYYVLLERSRSEAALCIEVRSRLPQASGWGKFRPHRISPESLRQMANPVDRELCAVLRGATAIGDEGPLGYVSDRGHATYQVPVGARQTLLKRLLDTERCGLSRDGSSDHGLKWAGDEPWRLWAVGEIDDGSESPEPEEGDAAPANTEPALVLRLELRRGEERMPIHRPMLMLTGPDGLAVYEHQVAPLDDGGAGRWVHQFRDGVGIGEVSDPIRVPLKEADKFLDRLYRMPNLPEMELPDEVAWPAEKITPLPHLEVFSEGASGGETQEQDDDDLADRVGKGQVAGRLTFSYGPQRIRMNAPGRYVPLNNSGSDTADQTAAAENNEEQTAEGPEETETAKNDSDESTSNNGDQAATAAAADNERKLLERDLEHEDKCLSLLLSLGFRLPQVDGEPTLALPSRQLPAVLAELISRGFDVTADRKAIAAAGTPALSVATGADWFELRGNVEFDIEGGTQLVSLPEILAAARAGQSMIKLDDGSQGLLPVEWLQENGILTSLGAVEGDFLKFESSQAAMLDSLLDRQPQVEIDDQFQQVRERLRSFTGVVPAEPSEKFQGTLRQYQCDGVGWMLFLRAFRFGGVLADDMGLGKTIQVLALLERTYHGISEGQAPESVVLDKASQAATGNGDAATSQPDADATTGTLPAPEHRPSLVVVPRSVVFNWTDEAAKFTPHLKLGVYTGADRHAMRDEFADHDVLVTSYGLMRRDIDKLIEHEYEYVILDEAQAIKNPMSQSAKAARTLRARNRIALTGTPVENHMGDLWSIFEFLNPGMLGTGARFTELIKGGLSDVRSVDAAEQVGKAIRPFILRRTKQQVLTDLPEKTEQTIYCEMEPEQQKVYDQLKEYYRNTLLNQSSGSGGNGENALGKTSGGGGTMMVLEALLRLRQAACHPALIDPEREDLPSAKLDTLMEQLEELIDEGHKTLVFSQFTSMLALTRKRLDEKGIRYAYLDGQTRDRRSEVDRFQNDPDLPVFLISLKAGGLGLNLTSAEYVFILDPWWNPAVEQQAIDRTHRIGQTRHVFAYRMICRDTVEQRIAELQQGKQKLADAIIGGEKGLLSSLTRDELERLLT